MAKALKAVGTAIVIVGAVVATGGAALALGAGVGVMGAASLATSAVLSVGGFSVSAGALLTVGGLVSSVGGSLSQPQVTTAGNALGWVGDPNGPMHFAAGRIAVGGDLRHKKAYGPNDRMYFSAVTVVSDAGPITAFESFTANDVPVTFDGSGKANSSYYANVMWRRTQLGNQPEPSYLASPSGLEGGAALPNWGASHKLSGKAAFILTLSENSKQSAYKGQQPKPRHVIRGLKAYDWRLDSTYPGGSGPHRLNQPTTWTYTANPILWAVKWILGLWEGPDHGGAPQLDTQVGGMGVRVENIDLAAFTEAANIADTHGWTCAAWPSTDDDKAQVLDAFLQAAGAYYIQRGGKESCIHRAAPRVSVATISAADTAGPIELDTGASFTQRKNTGVPTYLSEADGWKMTALGQVSAPEWVEEDGGRERSVPVTYSYVSNAKQAAELMCLAVAHTREGIRGRIPLKPYMQGIQPGSAFTITEPEFVLNGLKCLCLETNYDAMTGVHTVTFVSESDGKYDFAFGQSPSPPAPPALEAVDPTYVTPPQIGDWTIVPRPPAPGGGQLPGFDLGGIVSNETATSIIVEHGPSNTGPWKQAYEGPPTVTSIPIDGLQPGATYYIAIRYRRENNYSARYVYGPYTAPALIGDVMPDAPGLNQIKADIQDAFGDLLDLDLDLAATRLALEQADDALADQIGGVEDRADALEVVTAALEANKASITQLNAQITRINNVEAVNATQATAIIDLGNNKVALSEYNTLKAEVQNARDGSPTLLGKIQQLKAVDLDLQTNKASTSSVTNLTARTTQTEADIIDLELAQADEATARAAAFNQLAVSSGVSMNANPDFAAWTGVLPATYTGLNSQNGVFSKQPGINGAANSLRTASTSAAPFAFTQTIDGAAIGGEYVVAEIEFTLVSGNLHGAGIALLPRNVSNGFLKEETINFATTPDASNTVRGGGVPGRTYRFRRLLDGRSTNAVKYYVNGWVRNTPFSPNGAVTIDWHRLSIRAATQEDITSGVAFPALQASVTEQSLAIIDLENQQALASWQVVASATGGKPARIGLTSSTLGSFLALDAPYIFWGDNTVFDDATDTLQTTIGSNRRVLALGAPFGTGGTLLEWWGPSSVALGSMTTANGYNGRMTALPYAFDNTQTAGVSALRSSVGGVSNAGTTSSFATIGTASFSNLPPGGSMRLYAAAAPNNGMTIDGGGVGTSLTGEVRVVQNGSVIATGTMNAYASGGDADAQIFLNNMLPITPAQTGATSLSLQWRSTTSGKNIGGPGASITFYAEWTKNG